MQIVIDIPEGLKKDFELEQWTALSCMEMKDALINGTLLPKGHGKLMDADSFVDFLKNISKTQGYDEFIINKQLTGITVDDVFNIICESLQDENSAPTIIEADKAESEKEENTARWKQISPAKIYECSECGQIVMTDDIDVYKHCHGCGRRMQSDK